MRLHQLIENTDNSIEEIKKTIWYQSNNIPLFRGMDNYETIKIITDRDDREPSDTDLYVHTYINNHTKNKYGVKIRTGVFLTQSPKVAYKYGVVNLVIPKDNCLLYTNYSVNDFFSDVFVKNKNNKVLDASDEYIENIELYNPTKQTPTEIIGFGEFYCVPLDIARKYNLYED
jgi:hypothetical protein